MNGVKIKRAAAKQAEAIARQAEGTIIYGTVERGNQNDAGQTDTVRIVTEDGLSLPSVGAGGRQVAEGTRVALSARGRKGSETYNITSVVGLSMEQQGGNQNHIIDTPTIAQTIEYKTFLSGGIPVLWVAIIIWQITAQWRFGQHVGYELQWREASGNQTITTRTTDPVGQIAWKLNGNITTSTDPIPLALVPKSNPPSIQASPRFGRVEFQDGEIAQYNIYTQSVPQIEGMTRGVTNSSGIDTTPASHATGELVRMRTTTLAIPNLQSATAYEYRVRSLIGQQTSNWSDWTSYVTGGAMEATRLAEDFITNGQFPDDVDDWFLGGVSAATLDHSPIYGFREAGSAVIQETGGGSPTNPQLTQNGIAVVAGESNTVEAYVSVSDDIQDDGVFWVEVQFDGTSASFESVEVLGAKMLRIEDNQWVRFTLDAIAPKDATTATVKIHMFNVSPDGVETEVYVDDIRMYKTPQTKGIATEASADFDRLGAGIDSGDGAGAIVKIIHFAETWNPPSIASGAFALHTSTVAGAITGDKALAGLTTIAGNDMILEATVIATDTVITKLTNHEAGAIDLASGTLSILVFGSSA